MTSSWVTAAAGGLTLLWTLLPLSRSPRWWVRAFEFPRAQLAVLSGLMALLVYWLTGLAGGADRAVFVLILACTAYQLVRILPYTPLYRHQIAPVAPGASRDPLSVLVANVLMSNRQADDLLALVRTHEPDIVLTLESDAWWQERLDALAEHYPYRVRQPQGDTYGMHLYSRLAIVAHEVRFLVQDNVPSIHATVRLRGGDTVDLRCVHPAPPSPTENDTSVERDAELLLLARDIDAAAGPVIVIGDLNDVAWSSTTRLFQRMSGLLDPRIGRGTLGTFHARTPLLRWPLDHVFASPHFTLDSLQVLPGFGSDHLPVLVVFNHAPAARTRHAPPGDARPDERARARARIAESGVEPEAGI